MKILISYHSIGYGANLFATPEFTHSEIVEAKGLDDPKLIDYICNQKDLYDCKFEKKDKPFMGFDYVSNQGGVKVSLYNESKVIKL